MKTAQQLYEMDGVYGNKAKYDAAGDRFDAMIRIINDLPSVSRVLDIGCGTGYFSSMLRSLHPNFDLYGADISHAAIKTGKNLYPSIHLAVADAEKKLPYESKFFDLVVSGEHIAHLKETDTYISEIYRVLKPGGYLLITTPNLSSWLNRILFIFGQTPFFMEPSFVRTMPSVRLFGRSFPDPSMPPSGHLRLYSLNMLRFLLTLHRFATTRSWGVSSLTHPVVKGIDRMFARIPTLSSGIIVLAQKK